MSSTHSYGTRGAKRRQQRQRQQPTAAAPTTATSVGQLHPLGHAPPPSAVTRISEKSGQAESAAAVAERENFGLGRQRKDRVRIFSSAFSWVTGVKSAFSWVTGVNIEPRTLSQLSTIAAARRSEAALL